MFEKFGEFKPAWLFEDPERRARWDHLTLNEKEGLVIEDNMLRRQTELLLDNVAKQMIVDGLARVNEKGKVVVEATDTTGVSSFTTVAFPLIRRVWPTLIANELVTVQPIKQPTAKVFYLDFLRGSAGTPSSTYPSGQRLDNNFDTDYASGTEGGTVKEVDFRVSSTDVTAVEKKLKAKWTIEVEQDLKTYHGIGAEVELVKIMAAEIRREIDYEIVAALVTAATQSASSDGGAGAGNVNWSSTVPSTSPWNVLNPKEYKESLYESIIDANTLIYKKCYKNADWLVVDPDTCAILEKLDDFKLDPTANPSSFNVGLERVGTLKNRFKVYKHPDFQSNKILLGHKGTSWMDAGFVYAPYIALYHTPTLIDPDDFTPRKGVMSRYAKKVINAGCYATVTIT